MFKFSLRELVLFTTVAALTLGWWLDHRTHAEAAKVALEATEDARMLALFSARRHGLCSQEAFRLVKLQHKYGVEQPELSAEEAAEWQKAFEASSAGTAAADLDFMFPQDSFGSHIPQQ